MEHIVTSHVPDLPLPSGNLAAYVLENAKLWPDKTALVSQLVFFSCFSLRVLSSSHFTFPYEWVLLFLLLSLKKQVVKWQVLLMLLT